jgi:hypothetical protein
MPSYKELNITPPPGVSENDPVPGSYGRKGVARPTPKGVGEMRKQILPEPALLGGDPRRRGVPSGHPTQMNIAPGGTSGPIARPPNPVPPNPTGQGQVPGVRPEARPYTRSLGMRRVDPQGQADPTRRPDLESTQSGVRRRLASTPITPPTQPMGLPSATPTPPPGGPQPQGAGMPTDTQLEQLIRSLVGSEGNPRKMPRPELPLPGDPRGRPGAIGVARPGMGPNPQPMLGGPSNSLRRRGR